MTAICGRICPATLVKLPTATNFEPLASTASLSTLRTPRRGSVKGRSTSGSTAPVVASTAATPERDSPLIRVNVPARNRRVPVMRRSHTAVPVITAVNSGAGCPFVTSSLARATDERPFTVEKKPPTNTKRPSALAARASTRPSTAGVKR
jgi:hypothetical protein